MYIYIYICSFIYSYVVKKIGNVPCHNRTLYAAQVHELP